ncbi:MAG: PAS domain-containing protein [Myxococcales bacterium]|nr:PAS domain-containing protein [Myxococcales bacterium]
MAEPELEVLYDNAPVGMCVLDRELRFVRANERFASLHGRSVGEVVGRPMSDITHAAIREEALRVARQVLATGDPVADLEWNAPRAEDEGEERWWLVNCHALTAAGQVTGIAVVVQDVTARKRIEREAARRLDELESLYRSAPVGLAHLDRDLRYVRVNERLAQMNGLSAREHLGRRLRDISREAAKAVEPLLKSVVESGVRMNHIETLARAPSTGRERAYVLDLEPVKDASGLVQGVVVALHDVTNLKRAEATARARLEELDSLYRNAPVGLALVDADLRFVRANERMISFTGSIGTGLGGRPLEEIVPPEGDWAVQEVARVLETGRPARNLRFRGPGSGPTPEWRSLRIDLEPATGEGGEVTGVVAVVHDESDLRRAEEEARENIALAAAQLSELEAVYSAAPVGLGSIDDSLRFVRVNERMAALFGRPVHEFTGRPVGELLGSLAPQLQAALESVLATGSAVRDQRVDTAGVAWRFDHRPVKASDGSVRAIVICAQELPRS